ncbi:MAG: hypothetical protein A3F82_00015 [Deltaproteobacteria bacterium RIFCSPLOWO2_12_FULL_44_12]|nr:MAG: hypothetical protein A2712_09150 [Deltaproteobacteria bacterium RIFCSPHIGHO2_01_FULL_43_49]OGQ14489.1 MAG: hypothetical protein A3D22_09575 [Deltaproteobacteria bacterium RIFCSPHIGHO2_02_FULL_44_53]OGQ27870.1 MAG: hypothetical protein A3D98_03975 [Deltaproteobacteria bacterium RIFCSPHIGHO2_12_FULL_44_21]OGQ31010.1 MAG: hypothetical protein A2979_01650 [Deltaproteobacteria bacterium RIFCSPLOWO2_01_FULL_45_74]OGQ42606.1 MAG: hypothetical protein A3I70_03695 [Deltaproteobacteria bacterium 
MIGGFAIYLHGLERATKDIDFLVDPSEKNIQKIKEALKNLLPEACAELTRDDVTQNIVVRMVGENFIIDLVEKIGDINYANAKIITEKLDDVAVPLANLETMIELKKGMRERDKKDLLFLMGKKEFLEKQKK